jgi:micrococcal nuclease
MFLVINPLLRWLTAEQSHCFPLTRERLHSIIMLIVVLDDQKRSSGAWNMAKHRFKHPLVVALFLTLSPILVHDQSFAAQKLSEARVTTVHDGDTVTLLMNSKKVKCRLIGIDAPEMGQEPWGRKSREHLRKLLKQSDWRVYVETDAERQDKYKRLLIYLWLQNGELLNERMILDGYAFRFTMKPNTRYVDRLKKAQQAARDRKLGVWGPDGLNERPVDYKRAHPRT